MKKKEMTRKEKAEMAELFDISVEELDRRLAAQPAPSTSDSLFQSIRTDEDTALTRINMRMFQQEFSQDSDQETASP